MNKTPLMNAADYGDISMIKYMLKKMQALIMCAVKKQR
jgi:hypothetical protein